MIEQILFMEHLKVFNSFTETNILHRYLELVADSDDDTSLAVPSSFVIASSFT